MDTVRKVEKRIAVSQYTDKLGGFHLSAVQREKKPKHGKADERK